MSKAKKHRIFLKFVSALSWHQIWMVSIQINVLIKTYNRATSYNLVASDMEGLCPPDQRCKASIFSINEIKVTCQVTQYTNTQWCETPKFKTLRVQIRFASTSSTSSTTCLCYTDGAKYHHFLCAFTDLLSCVSEAIQIDLPFYEELVLFLLSSPDPHHEARHWGVQEVRQHAEV